MSGVDRTALPAPGPARPFRFPAVTQVAFDASGLDVRLVPHDAAPIVSLTALMRGGSAADPADRPGLAAFTADLLDDGAGTLDGPGLADALARLGGDVESEIWPDATVVTVTALARHVAPALGVLADLVRRPRFDPADVERVRGLRLDRLRQLRAQAATQADRAFTRAIYGGHPYGHPGIGDAAAVQAATRDDILAQYARAFRPSATTLVIAGDVGLDEARALVSSAFGDWAGAREPVAPPPVPGDPPVGRVLLLPRPGAPQSELRVGHVSASRRTPDYHALLLWNAALGGQFVSRLNLNLRQARGITYGVRSGFDFRRAPGPFSVHTSVQASATGVALQEITREVEAMLGARPITAQELARAKAAVGLGYPRGFETAQQVGRAVAQMSLHELSPDHFESFVPRVNAVSEGDATEAARRHVHAGWLTAVIVGDEAVVGPQLTELGQPYDVLPDAG